MNRLPGALSNDELCRYARHIVLPEIDCAGQARLLDSRALVVGLGGLGGAVALYLVASGVGGLIVNDDDTVDLSNLQRQVIYEVADVGRKKTDCTIDRLTRLNPHLSVSAIDRRLSIIDAHKVITGVDIVIDCSDNFATRFALNALCVQQRKPLVIGSATGFSGQVLLVEPSIRTGPCFRCVYPEEVDGNQPSCADIGVFAPLVGVVGTLQASIAVNTLLGRSESQAGKLTIINLADFTIRQVTVARDPHCPVCNPT